MKLTAPITLALCLTLPLPLTAQQAPTPQPAQTFTDPANLRGERVSPSNGHELPIDQGASGLAQLLRKLNTRASLLLITAHPDDEDGGMLTLVSRGLGARVATLTLNRGEGGQNFVTGDFNDSLGLIRTQELLSADRYFDTSQFFGDEVDFGFSKTRDESFQQWGHERVLYDAVRAIRIYRPLIIAAVFIGNVTDGHGQHQVSGEIAQEAFKAAADPNVFPDMIQQGILPWQALKVYAHVPWANVTDKGVFDYATNQYVPARFTNYLTGQITTTKPTADVLIPEGDTDPLLTAAAANPADLPASLSAASADTPLSYVQFARIGLGLQRTQISRTMRLPSSGPYNSSYHLYGSALCNAPADAGVPSADSVIRSEGTSGPTSNAVASPLSQSKGTGAPSQAPCIARAPALPPSAILPQDLANQPTFFSGIDTSIEGIATLAPSAPPLLRLQLARMAEKIATATREFNPNHPSAIAPPLADALHTCNALIGLVSTASFDRLQKANVLHELRIKQVQLNNALVLALGLHLNATAPASNLVENTSPEIETSLRASSSAPITLDRIFLQGAAPQQRQKLNISLPRPLTPATPIASSDRVPATLLTTLTQPYFYRDNLEQPVYQLRDPALRNAPQTPAPLTAWTGLNYQGTTILMGRIVHHGPQPVSIIPPVSIASAPSATVLPKGQPTVPLTATLTTDVSTAANINVQSPPNWSIQARPVPAPAADPTHSIHFFLHPTAPFTLPALFRVTAQTPDHHIYAEGFRSAGYPGLIYTNYYTPATTRVVPVDLKLPAHVRIAYLPGTGDAVPQALASIGLAPTLITVADLTPARLADFNTVILGVRAYTAHPDLHGAPTTALLDFARAGGNVLVQYETSDFTSADAPYPLSLGYADKVVVETDPVQLLVPTNPLLTTPNQITSADFDSWIEERGHGFLASWDSHYTALTETHDPGGDGTAPQLPQRGGLITAAVGEGRWTYCAFALYRQLPEAVPGAFRIFVNLISPASPDGHN